MIIRRISPLSAGKLAGALYGIMGLIFGVIFALIGMAGAAAGAASSDVGAAGALTGMLFGVGAVVILPIFYGVLGFVMTAFTAWLYNIMAGLVGGIEIDVEQR
ncbi:MAG: DUF3566 domain-containing protein [Acidobacteria bacterium]|nr:DUF3566 domain-containing protein [Acidobacteriota bacterium]